MLVKPEFRVSTSFMLTLVDFIILFYFFILRVGKGHLHLRWNFAAIYGGNKCGNWEDPVTCQEPPPSQVSDFSFQHFL